MTNPPPRATALADLKKHATALAHHLMKPRDESLEVKDRCRRRTLVLVRSGRLVRQPCEACGAERVVAHHENYRRPDHVRWVCHLCHHAVHHRGSVLPGKLPSNPDRDDIAQWLAVLVLRTVASTPEPPKPPKSPALFLTLAEASLVSGLSQADLRRKCQSGWSAAIKDGAWKIRRKDLEAL